MNEHKPDKLKLISATSGDNRASLVHNLASKKELLCFLNKVQALTRPLDARIHPKQSLGEALFRCTKKRQFYIIYFTTYTLFLRPILNINGI